MVSSEKISSMETLEQCLLQNSAAVSDAYELIKHLVKVCQNLEDIPSRDFLLRNAEYFSSFALQSDGKSFIAKRLYAFLRKNSFAMLVKNLQYFPDSSQKIPCSAVVDLLQFEDLAEQIQRTFQRQQEKKTSSSHDVIKLEDVFAAEDDIDAMEAEEGEEIEIEASSTSVEIASLPDSSSDYGSDSEVISPLDTVTDMEIMGNELEVDLGSDIDLDGIDETEDSGEDIVQDVMIDSEVFDSGDLEEEDTINDNDVFVNTGDESDVVSPLDTVTDMEITGSELEILIDSSIELDSKSDAEVTPDIDSDFPHNDSTVVAEAKTGESSVLSPLDTVTDMEITGNELEIDIAEDLEVTEEQWQPEESEYPEVVEQLARDYPDSDYPETSSVDSSKNDDELWFEETFIASPKPPEVDKESSKNPRIIVNQGASPLQEETFVQEDVFDSDNFIVKENPGVQEESLFAVYTEIAQDVVFPDEPEYSKVKPKKPGKPVPLFGKLPKTKAEKNATSSPTDDSSIENLEGSSFLSSGQEETFYMKKAIELEEMSNRRRAEMEDGWKELQSLKRKKIPWDVDKSFVEKLQKLQQQQQRRVQYFPKIIQAVIRQCKNAEEKYPWMRLKFTSLQYSNVITRPANVLVWVNYGIDEGKKILKEVSQITESESINNNVYEYLFHCVDKSIQEHATNFKKSLESCQSRYDLLCLLALYPLYSKTTLKEYRNLRIIEKIKMICFDVISHGVNAEKALNKHLRLEDVNIKKHLLKLLVEDSIENQITHSLGQVKNIGDLLKQLKQLKAVPGIEKTAETLFHLIVTFLRDRQGIPYDKLQVSLNFVSASLQHRILRIIKKKLHKDLHRKLGKILESNDVSEKRWKKMLELLRSPQLKATDLKIFGYTLENFLSKLEQLSHSDNKIEEMVDHLFDANTCPDNLRRLITSYHHAKFKTPQYNVESCYESLQKIVAEAGEDFSLRRGLVDLFQCYGQVEFSQNQASVSGYEISRIISRFYQNPSRTVIEIPVGTHDKIAKLVTESINEERARQLSKLEK